MVIKRQQREWTVKTMENEYEYMTDYQPSAETILRRAQQKTLHDMAQQSEAMLKHINDLENALTNIFTLWFELADSSDITEAMRHHLNNFAYLYTEPTDKEE